MGKMHYLLILLHWVAAMPAQPLCLKGNCEEGYGEQHLASGERYIGEFFDGKFHGQGIMYFQNGDKYLGSWRHNLRYGQGRLQMASGDVYEGAFINNQFQGFGTMIFADGRHYEGQWVANRMEGMGKITYPNGEWYTGHFSDGFFDGSGTYHYQNGARYEGSWKDGRRHGPGKLFAADNTVQNGEWIAGVFEADGDRRPEVAFNTAPVENELTERSAGLRDCNEVFCALGIGRFRYDDGRIYEGDFSAGIPRGLGTVHYPNGDRYEGNWESDEPRGRGVMYYHNGRTVGAVWENGEPVKVIFEEQGAPGEMASRGDDFDPQVKVWAVVVGASQYYHMRSLRYTDDDAYQLFAFLKSPAGGALPDEQIRLLIDEDANLRNIIGAMRTSFLKADENDVVLFYFSGHGIQGAFLPVDFDGFNNRLHHEDIRNLLDNSRAKHKIVIADACHSGSLFAQRQPAHELLDKFYTAFENVAGGTALLLSSKGEEYSMEDGGLRSGVYSHFLVRGLKGAADADRSGIVTVQEIYNYTFENVMEYTGSIQHPILKGNFDVRMPVSVVH